MPPVRKRKNRFLPVLIFCLALASCLAAAEVFLRLFLPVNMMVLTSHAYDASFSPILGYEPRPGVLEHNSLGLRGPETATKKPDQTFRVAVLGDSVAYGIGVKEKETFSRLLEKHLGQEPGGGHVEVLNLAVPGYGVEQAAERLRLTGLDFSPDLVLYDLSLDDPAENFARVEALFFSDEDQILLSQGQAFEKTVRFLFQLQLVRRAWVVYRNLRLNQAKKEKYPQGPVQEKYLERLPSATRQAYWDFLKALAQGEWGDISQTSPEGSSLEEYFLYYDLPSRFAAWETQLRRIASMSRKAGALPVLAVNPVLVRNQGGSYPYGAIHRLIKIAGREAGFHVLDLSPALAAYHPQEVGIGDFEHPNAKGHEVMAQALASYLLPLIRAKQKGEAPEKD